MQKVTGTRFAGATAITSNPCKCPQTGGVPEIGKTVAGTTGEHHAQHRLQ